MPTDHRPGPLRVVAAVIADGGWDTTARDERGPHGRTQRDSAPVGRLLACRRAPGRDAAGRWEFPGGKVEPGESAEAALEREIREELGVRIRVGVLLDRTVTGRVDLACYAATLCDDAPTASTDHDALRWVRPDELDGLAWADADRPAVALLAVVTSTNSSSSTNTPPELTAPPPER